MKLLYLLILICIGSNLTTVAGNDAADTGGFFRFAKGIMDAIQIVKTKLRSHPKGKIDWTQHPRSDAVHNVAEETIAAATNVPKINLENKQKFIFPTKHAPLPTDPTQQTPRPLNVVEQEILIKLGDALPKYNEKSATETTKTTVAPAVIVLVEKPVDQNVILAKKIASTNRETTIEMISKFLEPLDQSRYVGHPTIERQIQKEKETEKQLAMKRKQEKLDKQRRFDELERKDERKSIDHNAQYDGERINEHIPNHDHHHHMVPKSMFHLPKEILVKPKQNVDEDNVEKIEMELKSELKLEDDAHDDHKTATNAKPTSTILSLKSTELPEIHNSIIEHSKQPINLSEHSIDQTMHHRHDDQYIIKSHPDEYIELRPIKQWNNVNDGDGDDDGNTDHGAFIDEFNQPLHYAADINDVVDHHRFQHDQQFGQLPRPEPHRDVDGDDDDANGRLIEIDPDNFYDDYDVQTYIDHDDYDEYGLRTEL